MFKKSLLIALIAPFIFFFAQAQSKVPAKLSGATSKLTAKQGEDFFLQISVDVKKGYHTYSTMKYKDDMGPMPTEISVAAKSKQAIKIKGKITSDPKPHRFFDKVWGFDVEEFSGKANFIVPVSALKDIDFKKDKISLVSTMQFCDSMTCQDHKIDVAIKPTLFIPKGIDAKDEVAVAPTPAANDTQKTVPAQNSAEVKQAKPAVMVTESQTQINDMKKKGIFSFLWLAMSAGALALLTPCVFPMVPITVSFFTKRAEKNKGQGLRDSLIYTLGIITTFTILGFVLALFFGATGIRDFASNPIVNLSIATIFIVFSLNLFGAFEIQIPTGLLNKLDSKSQGGGIVSVLLMGLTFSLTSFTCTVPFVGSALLATVGGEWFYPIIGMLGFSGVFAAPFFLLALFPSAMKTLPKAGGWMNNVKVVMGFLEIAAAIKFISNADLVLNWGIMPKEMFLGIWIACFGLIVLYILGLFRLPHDGKVDGVGAGRLMFALFFFSITMFLFTGLFGKPLGELDAFLPPAEYREIMNAGNAANSTTGAKATPIKVDENAGKEVWLDNYDQALVLAKKENKPLFIDFTGFTCTNCRWMEQNAFKSNELISRLNSFVKVKLYTDRDKEPFISNKKLQESAYGSIELPLYVILTPNGELVGTKTFDRDLSVFVAFLDKGINSVKK